MSLIRLRHNIEVAHRLSLLPGKCENIHGHSMWVELNIFGDIGATGILQNGDGEKFEFGKAKQAFRDYLDKTYDHHLLLNKTDPWAQPLYLYGEDWENNERQALPGLVTFDGDPTTENLARWIAEWSAAQFRAPVEVNVQETHVNAAMAGATWLYDQNKVGAFA